ncbi:hypothetical protein J2Y45_002137 [Dyadobacter sp. BE34]|uniref:Lipoprotein n=1 Tax=Dyadobacter fermentans TaxID=94254 RepID=A0ABU1QY07_9BACT|nr:MULTISPECIES: hypothetical protein [Dyadobacter]MDR6805554.1 hypothetical protein [Dyadobacter fermentans]MDR7042686.1 hypothetical protein [Dyadobacter sp. BE242]MDR7196998.1 hypothetical protein [Dyadobacter sp. BE34]MDR7215567.1 hypothetical protein [Dyadobacter sp. BE31]MDR7263103.1 hypothetical protein [Dyadobacter sp. BE32]
MKKLYGVLVLSASILLFGCPSDPDPDPTTPPATVKECNNGDVKFYDVLAKKSINCWDNTFGSPTQGVFSVLTLTQNRFQSCVNGKFELKGLTENIVSFKNVTEKTISFDYTITQNYSGNIRQHQGFVSNLKPGAVDEVNTGDNTFYNLNGSQLQVVVNKITAK